MHVFTFLNAYSSIWACVRKWCTDMYLNAWSTKDPSRCSHDNSFRKDLIHHRRHRRRIVRRRVHPHMTLDSPISMLFGHPFISDYSLPGNVTLCMLAYQWIAIVDLTHAWRAWCMYHAHAIYVLYILHVPFRFMMLMSPWTRGARCLRHPWALPKSL